MTRGTASTVILGQSGPPHGFGGTSRCLIQRCGRINLDGVKRWGGMMRSALTGGQAGWQASVAEIEKVTALVF